MSLAIVLAVLAAQDLATPESDAVVRVVSPGRYETTFTKRKGFGGVWFDLKHDPGRKRDLAPVLDENGFFWIKIGKPGTDGSWYANPAEELALLENGPVRVRVRLRGAHMRYGNTDAKAAWKELRFEQTWTLYADGSAYVCYVLEQAEPVPYHHFLVITKPNGAWGPQGRGEGKGEAHVAGEQGEAKPTSKSPTSFTLQWTDGPTYFTDILMVAQQGKFGASYWNEGYQDKDLRCSFDLGSRWPDKTLPAGKERVNFLLRFADDVNSAATGALHAADYRTALRPTLTKGELVTADEGDRDGDGFNEEEGCTVLKAAADGVAFTIPGKTIPRFNPAFKIRDWASTAPPAVEAGGRKVVVAVRDRTLLVQILGAVSADQVVTIR